ncbi:PAS domain-containing protein [Nannocystis sp. SCPEA4]|uniref:PAS domain-containing protein n=1 Tax=Nannocystis sp. SCPEA4 TaxID=2996787 RepID=UPI00227134A6|nr:PAS domain-containing protein [Nannocystis sp. SCPEA4]MCY1056654.1 PAS domain-containing protein [Nannocystis sp. SCPEA4]
MTDSREEMEALRAALRAAEARADGLAAAITGASGTAVTLHAVGGVHRALAVDGTEALLGHTAAECHDWPDFWRAVVHPEDLERVLAGLTGPGPICARLRRRDGSHVDVAIHTATRADQPDLVHALLLACGESRRLAAENRVLRQRLDGFVSNIPGIAWESYFQQSAEMMTVDYVSEVIEPMSGYTVEEWKQPNFWLELIHPDDRAAASADAEAIFHRGRGSSSYRWITRDGRTLWVTSRMSIIFADDGAPIGLRGVTMDETSIKEAEAQRLEARMREEVIRAQEATLMALSTPLIPIDDETVVMPLIGTLDPRRIEQVQQTLLDGVAGARAKTVIVDITGVPEIDAQSAEALLRAARAVALLGAESVITGIRPDVAAALVGLGADLRSLVTLGTLKAGIAYAMNRRR